MIPGQKDKGGLVLIDGASLMPDCVKPDNRLLIDGIARAAGGMIGRQFAALPCGQGRTEIVGGGPGPGL